MRPTSRDAGRGADRPVALATRGPVWVWLVIPAVALGVRLFYLYEIWAIPFFDTPVGDAARYDAWGAEIAGGEWLGKETFYQAPAYPYLIGVVYSITGRSLFAIRVVQACFGALACLFVALAGRAFVSRRAGIVAGLLLAIYPPAIFFDGIIQKASLGLVLLCAMLWGLGMVLTGSKRRAGMPAPRVISSLAPNDVGHPVGAVAWLVVGVVLGALALTRENALVLVVVIVGWLAIGFRGLVLRKRAACASWFALGLALALGPVAIRNRVVGGVWALTTVQAGPNFYIGNHQGASGLYVPLVPGHESPQFEQADARRLASQAVGRELSDADVSQFWFDEAWAFISADPGGWVRLLGRKALLTLNAYEISDVEGFSVYRLYSSLLNILAAILHFGVLAPLAAAGVVFCRRDGRPIGLLLTMAAVLALSVAAFFVLARYRFPLAPIAVIFAGAGAVGAYDCLRSRSYRKLATPTAAALIAAAICNWPVNQEQELDGMALGNLGTVLAQNGRMDEALAAFGAAAEVNPNSAATQYNLGLALRLTGDTPGAIEHLSAAKQLSPNLVDVDFQLGQLYEAVGKKDKALHHFHEAVRIDPNDAAARTAAERLSSGR